jgi:hypothetical protein
MFFAWNPTGLGIGIPAGTLDSKGRAPVHVYRPGIIEA